MSEAAPTRRILLGDARTVLATLPEGSVDTVVTSPPYFRLSDYGVAGQLGLEDHVDAWTKESWAVMAEGARVLSPTGTSG